MPIMLRELAMCMALAEPCVNFAQSHGYVHDFSRTLCQLCSELAMCMALAQACVSNA